jgi:hypothetical protein
MLLHILLNIPMKNSVFQMISEVFDTQDFVSDKQNFWAMGV